MIWGFGVILLYIASVIKKVFIWICCRLGGCRRKIWNCRSSWICTEMKVVMEGKLLSAPVVSSGDRTTTFTCWMLRTFERPSFECNIIFLMVGWLCANFGSVLRKWWLPFSVIFVKAGLILALKKWWSNLTCWALRILSWLSTRMPTHTLEGHLDSYYFINLMQYVHCPIAMIPWKIWSEDYFLVLWLLFA